MKETPLMITLGSFSQVVLTPEKRKSQCYWTLEGDRKRDHSPLILQRKQTLVLKPRPLSPKTKAGNIKCPPHTHTLQAWP